MKKILLWVLGILLAATAAVCALFIITDINFAAAQGLLREIKAGSHLSYTEGLFLKADNADMIILKDGSPCTMSNMTGKDGAFSDFEDGDAIKVLNGGIRESYPGQITVYDVKAVPNAGVGEIPEETLISLKELGFIK